MTFKYYENFPSFNIAEVFCVRIDPDIKVGSELIKSLYYSLWFPGYFGFNWDALNDCLNDFHWMDCKKIVLIHKQIPDLSFHEVKIYLDILNDAVLSWENDDAHEFEVYFKLSDKKRVEEIIKT